MKAQALRVHQGVQVVSADGRTLFLHLKDAERVAQEILRVSQQAYIKEEQPLCTVHNCKARAMPGINLCKYHQQRRGGPWRGLLL
jgi:hypothetical protein